MGYVTRDGETLDDMDFATALDLVLEHAEANLPDEEDVEFPNRDILFAGVEALNAFADDHADELDGQYTAPTQFDPACAFRHPKPIEEWEPKYSWMDSVAVALLLAGTDLPEDDEDPDDEQIALKQAIEILGYLAARYGSQVAAEYAITKLEVGSR